MNQASSQIGAQSHRVLGQPGMLGVRACPRKDLGIAGGDRTATLALERPCHRCSSVPLAIGCHELDLSARAQRLPRAAAHERGITSAGAV